MRREWALLVCTACAALLVTGCGANAGAPQQPIVVHRREPLAQRQARSCVAALSARQVEGASAAVQDRVQGKWSEITLASDLNGGPIAAAGHASSVQTATWNVLSRTAAKPLTAYLGKTLSVVSAEDPPRAGATCLELGAKVVGLYAETSSPSAPMGDVSLQGQTVPEVTGLDYLAWLEQTGVYVPHPVENSPSMGALAVLLDYFDAINAGKQGILTTLATPNVSGRGLLALVPLSIERVTDMGTSASMDPNLSREFEVPLWPRFAGSPAVAGNGWRFMFFVVQRSSPQAEWMVTNAGTGP